MQTMFRLPWSADTCAEKPALDRVVGQKPRQMPLPVDFMAKLKRAHPSSSPPRSPDHAHITKKLKAAHCALPTAPPLSAVHLANMPLTPTEPAMHAEGFFGPTPRTASNTDAGTPAARREASHDAARQAAAPAVQEPSKADRCAYKVQAAVQTQTPGPSPSSVTTGAAMRSAEGEVTAQSKVTRYQLQQVIRLQLDQAILFKHNEMRCIEQELAKCQIALEQIRRCQIVPYPSGRSVSEMTDPALAPPPGYALPESAAPWGVTDGPYTRHYAHWLIPDPKFDATPIHTQVQPLGRFEPMQHSAARTSRSSRACTSIYSPTANAAEAPRRDPMIMKRKADGRWVRLFDHVCNRGDYRNVQGFMNHCRMSHKEDLVDHEGAAKAYGIPLTDADIAELGLENDPQRPPVPVPRKSASAPVVAPAAPVASAPAVSNAPEKTKEERGRLLVHPLIHSAPTTQKLPQELVDVLYPPTPVSRPASHAATPVNSCFVPSTKMPHLSSILQKRGSGLNMRELVAEASEKIDLDSVIPLPIDDGTLAPSSLLNARKAPLAASPSKRLQQPAARHVAPFAVDSSIRPGALEIPESPTDDAELSPCTAGDGNPGLVSDHDDAEDDDEFMHDDLLALSLSREKHPVHVADGEDEDVAMMDVDAAKGRSSKMG